LESSNECGQAVHTAVINRYEAARFDEMELTNETTKTIGKIIVGEQSLSSASCNVTVYYNSMGIARC
jgi:hypothetical protein